MEPGSLSAELAEEGRHGWYRVHVEYGKLLRRGVVTWSYRRQCFVRFEHYEDTQEIR